MSTTPTASFRPLSVPNQDGFGSPPRPAHSKQFSAEAYQSPPRSASAPVHNVLTPEGKHFTDRLANTFESPDKRYVAGKPVHSLIPTLTPKDSPYKDAQRVREGDCKVLKVGGKTVYEVISQSTGTPRQYQEHQSSASKRLIPRGPGVLQMSGQSVANIVSDFHRNSPTSDPAKLIEQLKNPGAVNRTSQPPAQIPPAAPKSSLSSLSFIPRQVAKGLAESKRKTPSPTSANETSSLASSTLPASLPQLPSDTHVFSFLDEAPPRLVEEDKAEEEGRIKRARHMPQPLAESSDP